MAFWRTLLFTSVLAILLLCVLVFLRLPQLEKIITSVPDFDTVSEALTLPTATPSSTPPLPMSSPAPHLPTPSPIPPLPPIRPYLYIYDFCIDADLFKDGKGGVSFTCTKARSLNWHDDAYNHLFRHSRHRVYNPKEADFFYVPTRVRIWLNKFWDVKKDSCDLCGALEREIVHQLHKVGKYWDKFRDRHIVAGAQCPRKDKVLLNPDRHFPALFGGSTLVLCVNAERNTIDPRRALHSPYYVLKEYVNQTDRPRNLLAVFMGAVLPENNKWWFLRKYLIEGLRKCKDCEVVELNNHFAYPKWTTRQNWNDLMYRSHFSIVPPGDTLERASRDQAIAMGVVPVYFDFVSGDQQHMPLSPPLQWDSFSINFTLKPSEWPGRRRKGPVSFWPRLESFLRSIVDSGKIAQLREGLAQVQARLLWQEDGVVNTLFQMLGHSRSHDHSTSPVSHSSDSPLSGPGYDIADQKVDLSTTSHGQSTSPAAHAPNFFVPAPIFDIADSKLDITQLDVPVSRTVLAVGLSQLVPTSMRGAQFTVFYLDALENQAAHVLEHAFKSGAPGLTVNSSRGLPFVDFSFDIIILGPLWCSGGCSDVAIADELLRLLRPLGKLVLWPELVYDALAQHSLVRKTAFQNVFIRAETHADHLPVCSRCKTFNHTLRRDRCQAYIDPKYVPVDAPARRKTLSHATSLPQALIKHARIDNAKYVHSSKSLRSWLEIYEECCQQSLYSNYLGTLDSDGAWKAPDKKEWRMEYASWILKGKVKRFLDAGAGTCTMDALFRLHGLAKRLEVYAAFGIYDCSMARVCAERGSIVFDHDWIDPIPVCPTCKFDLVFQVEGMHHIAIGCKQKEKPLTCAEHRTAKVLDNFDAVLACGGRMVLQDLRGEKSENSEVRHGKMVTMYWDALARDWAAKRHLRVTAADQSGGQWRIVMEKPCSVKKRST